jgi:hypothetical protein
MQKLTRKDLLSLEQYAERRPEMRRDIMAHKKNRHVALGEHVTLLFEDRMTIHYQIQEMLRAERIFEAAGIQEELDAYNPLIPDGDNLKATMLIEYENVDERQQALARLKGIEQRVWVQIGDRKTYAIADEDLERENEQKTASVHFLRFQFDGCAADLLRQGAAFRMGVDHANYREQADATDAQRQSLLRDFDA